MSIEKAIHTLDDKDPDTIGLDVILDAVSKECRIPIAYLQGPMRWKDYVRARHIYCYVARVIAGEKWLPIAAMLKRDHCTAHNSMSRVRANPAEFEPQLSRVIARVYGDKKPKEMAA